MTLPLDQEARLFDEADYFHRSLFHEEAPHEICTRYLQAHRYVFKSNEEGTKGQETRRITTILKHKLDVEAIELVLRRKWRKNLLTQKIHILLYLAESDPKYYLIFYNTKVMRLRAYLLLGFFSLRSVAKFLKGKFLIWRHRLV